MAAAAKVPSCVPEQQDAFATVEALITDEGAVLTFAEAIEVCASSFGAPPRTCTPTEDCGSVLKISETGIEWVDGLVAAKSYQKLARHHGSKSVLLPSVEALPEGYYRRRRSLFGYPVYKHSHNEVVCYLYLRQASDAAEVRSGWYMRSTFDVNQDVCIVYAFAEHSEEEPYPPK